MNEKETESKLKKFIKDAFTSEAKASRIPFYFFIICILLAVICIQLNTVNRYLKKISSGGLGSYSFETNGSSSDPFEIFSEKSTESDTETTAKNQTPETNSATAHTTESPSESAVQSKPQGSVKTYVINKNSKKIHYPTCSYAANMKEENRLTVSLTEEELNSQYLSNGYVFCSRCAG